MYLGEIYCFTYWHILVKFKHQNQLRKKERDKNKGEKEAEINKLEKKHSTEGSIKILLN